VVLVAAVALLLVMFGVGAALLPPSFLADPQSTSTNGASTAGAGAGGPQVSAGGPTATASATPSPTVTSAKPKPSPKRTTTPKRTPSRTSTRSSTGSSVAQQVLAIVNRERSEAGCRAVTLNSRLNTAAERHSEDQAEHGTMSHTGSDGSSPWDRAERAGYSNAIGENVAAGYRTASAVMEGWMDSPGHRANILNCDARAMGLGMAAAGDGTRYWTQMFGSVG